MKGMVLGITVSDLHGADSIRAFRDTRARDS